MSNLRAVPDTATGQVPTTASGKPAAPFETEVIYPNSLGVAQVATYCDAEGAHHLARALKFYNEHHPGQVGRGRWVDEVSALHHAAIELATFNGALPATSAVLSPFEVVRSVDSLDAARSER